MGDGRRILKEVVITPSQAQILALLREGRTVEGARRSIGINRSTLYPECG